MPLAAAIAAGWDPVAPLPIAAGAEQAPTALRAQPAGGWRERVNETLAKATGYELRRASTKR